MDGKSIATALQDAAFAEGAQLLAMGGFGHSHLRGFILGGKRRACWPTFALRFCCHIDE